MRPQAKPKPVITTVHSSETEERTKAILLGLLERHDLSKWQFTETVQIEDGVIPHSHPILTLRSEVRAWAENYLLAMYVHEQLHWYLMAKRGARAAVEEIRQLYPSVPVGGTEGARDEYSTRLHLVLCYLEYQALVALLGPEEAYRVFNPDNRKVYKFIHREVLNNAEAIAEIVRRHGLEL